jgi:4-hydroxythreonine-4-phosphate dehydrogenase
MTTPTVAITIGDFNGIGPEVVLKSVVSARVRRVCHPVLVGPLDIFQWYATRLKLKLHLQPVSNDEQLPPGRWLPVVDLGIFHPRDVRFGVVSPVAGTGAGMALHKAAELCIKKRVNAVVTAPVSKTALHLAGYTYAGQTEFLADLTGSENVTMMLLSKKLRIGLVTTHIPLREVASSITIEKVFATIVTVNSTLKNVFGLRNPRIAVLGLNPHGGEGGLLGTEEEKVVLPGIELAKTQHIRAFGPFSSDSFFGHSHSNGFDAVIAMYHDQGLIPLKLACFGSAVNFSAGLKITRTSPDHGTAFDIAGKGTANPSSMIEAISLAAEISRRRKNRTR